MNICIIAPNFAPEFTGCGKYSTDIATVLAKDGHKILILTGNPHYPSVEEFIDNKTQNSDLDRVIIERITDRLGRFSGLMGRLYDSLHFGFCIRTYIKREWFFIS